jgi:uncharacterized protein YegP (UPF0339 family)
VPTISQSVHKLFRFDSHSLFTIHSVKRFIVYRDPAREWHWELRLPNGSALAKGSESVLTEAAAREAVRSVRRVGAAASIVVEVDLRKIDDVNS